MKQRINQRPKNQNSGTHPKRATKKKNNNTNNN